MCVSCIVDLKAAFAYKTMCEKNDKKLRSVFSKHLSRVKIKLERIDEQQDTEIESKIDADEYPFEVNWFQQLDSEIAKVELSPTSNQNAFAYDSKIGETVFATQLFDDSDGPNGLDTMDGHEHSEDEFKMNTNDTLNENSDLDKVIPEKNIRSV